MNITQAASSTSTRTSRVVLTVIGDLVGLEDGGSEKLREMKE